MNLYMEDTSLASESVGFVCLYNCFIDRVELYNCFVERVEL